MSGINSEFDSIIAGQFSPDVDSIFEKQLRKQTANKFASIVRTLLDESVQEAKTRFGIFSIPLSEGMITVAINGRERLTTRPGLIVITNLSRWARDGEPNKPLGTTVETSTTLLPNYIRKRPIVMAGNFYQGETGQTISRDYYATRISLEAGKDTASISGYLGETAISGTPVAGSLYSDTQETEILERITEILSLCQPHLRDPSINRIQKEPYKPQP